MHVVKCIHNYVILSEDCRSYTNIPFPSLTCALTFLINPIYINFCVYYMGETKLSAYCIHPIIIFSFSVTK